MRKNKFGDWTKVYLKKLLRPLLKIEKERLKNIEKIIKRTY